MSPNSVKSPRPVSGIDAKSIKIKNHSPATENATPLVHLPEISPGSRLLDAMWPSLNLAHQIGILDRQNHRFKNLPVDGAANATERAQKLSSEGKEVYFACAEYLTPDSRTAANASGACAFWMDIDCGEDKAAAGKGYATVDDAEDALRKFCRDTGLPKPTHIVHSGGGLHLYWVLDDVISREAWQSYAKKLKDLTKVCDFLADDSRTADIASVLRLPGTLNQKNTPPRPVVLKYASDVLIKQSAMLDAIAGAHKSLRSPVATKIPARPTTAVSTTNASSKTSISADTYGEPDLDKLALALVWLDSDCDEETWKLKRLAPLALAARNHPELSSMLYELTRSWSSGELCGQESMAWVNPGGNGRTGEEVFDSVWERFLKDEYTGVPTTLGTVYYDAEQAGWDPQEQFQIIDVAVEGND